ncbi:hypothetical protein NU219Hw_g1030t1 [Hortaea werneckii]
MVSTFNLGCLVGIAAACLYLLYRVALPKPIAGIPYNKHSATRMFGDVPDALAWYRKRQELFSYLAAQTVKLNSPIVQVFLRPFGKPWVILADFREAQDIMVRRTREFDRSDFFGDLFFTLGPGNQVHMPTGDEWRAHRKLMADTMSNSFLHDVIGPQIHSTALDIIELWKQKTRLADGRPFDATKDVYKGALDVIWAATFGSEVGTTKKQVAVLSETSEVKLAHDKDTSVRFPTARDPEAFTALMTISDTIEIALHSPVPRWHHWLVLQLTPSLRTALKSRDALLTERLTASYEQFREGEKEGSLKSAMDLVVQRETIMARKEGREPQYDTMAIRDELLGFLIAGHETTSTTLCWAIKFLTAHQDIQEKLRSALNEAFSHAKSVGENPTIEDIVKSHIPYLDATIEETHRCGGTVSSNIRRAKEDAEVLGTIIPKGTDVFMVTNGPGYLEAPLPIDESKRSKTSQESRDKNGMWEVSDIGVFKPERWLIRNEDGQTDFDARAGPAQPFGAGPRGCFGRKLASLELKIIIVLIVWNFRLLPTPPQLSSFLGQDKITHTPQQCYLRLAEVR